MPTLMAVGQYRFFIVMRYCDERAHVHISGGRGKEAKCWLLPAVEVAANRGYTRHELDRIERLVRDGAERLIRRWNEECGAALP